MISCLLTRRMKQLAKRPLAFATIFFLANHFFMKQPSYRLRHWYLRKFCKLKIGEGSSINMGCFITGDRIEIGSNTVINRNVYLDGRVSLKIGNRVSISHMVVLQTLSHDPQSPYFYCVERPVEIGDYVWIGTHALILPGVRIGEGAVVAAGSVVTRDVPAYSIVAGNPARVIRERAKDLRYIPKYFPYFDTDVQPE